MGGGPLSPGAGAAGEGAFIAAAGALEGLERPAAGLGRGWLPLRVDWCCYDGLGGRSARWALTAAAEEQEAAESRSSAPRVSKCAAVAYPAAAQIAGEAIRTGDGSSSPSKLPNASTRGANAAPCCLPVNRAQLQCLILLHKTPAFTPGPSCTLRASRSLTRQPLLGRRHIHAHQQHVGSVYKSGGAVPSRVQVGRPHNSPASPAAAPPAPLFNSCPAIVAHMHAGPGPSGG